MDLVNQEWFRQLFFLPASEIPWWAEVVRSVLRLLIGVLGALGAVPFLVWWERRFLGFLQGRLGPNRVGPFGLLQPFADALKLMIKEDIIPTNVDRTLYVIGPGVALAPIIMSVTVLPWNASREWGAVAPNLDIGILFLLAVASIEVYGVILAGWSSNNKYSLLGGLRASSQVISYELGMGLSIISVLLMCGSLGTQNIVMGFNPMNPHLVTPGMELTNGQGHLFVNAISGSQSYVVEQAWWSGFWHWNVFRYFPFGLVAALIYMVSMIAETNRAPFDLPEAETELVAGFHTEYSSFKFAMFFMGEYANMLIVSAICVTLFFGGWLAPFGILGQIPAGVGGTILPAGLVVFLNYFVISPFWFVAKLVVLVSFFILVRATFPRLRYDMLMRFGWRGMLPTALVNLTLLAISIGIQTYLTEQNVILPQADLTTRSATSWWIGQAVAWVIGAIVAALVFNAYRSAYYARKKAAQTTDLVPVLRDSVTVKMAPRSAPEN